MVLGIVDCETKFQFVFILNFKRGSVVRLTKSKVGLLDSSVISNVFSLGVNAIQFHSNLLCLITAILVDDALGPFLVLF